MTAACVAGPDDERSDPGELRNLAADPAYRQTLARLEALLEG